MSAAVPPRRPSLLEALASLSARALVVYVLARAGATGVAHAFGGDES